jgi:hypothetical protein
MATPVINKQRHPPRTIKGIFNGILRMPKTISTTIAAIRPTRPTIPKNIPRDEEEPEIRAIKLTPRTINGIFNGFL